MRRRAPGVGRVRARALARRLRDQLTVDDRVRLAPSLDVCRQRADRRVVGVCGQLLSVVEAGRARLAVRVFNVGSPALVLRVPPDAPELGRRLRQRARGVGRDYGGAVGPSSPFVRSSSPFWRESSPFSSSSSRTRARILSSSRGSAARGGRAPDGVLGGNARGSAARGRAAPGGRSGVLGGSSSILE